MKLLKIVAAVGICVVSCSCVHRPLSSNEAAFLRQFHHTQVNYSEVQIYKGYWPGLRDSEIGRYLQVGNDKNNVLGRPVTIAEARAVLRKAPSAITLGNKIYFNSKFWRKDILPEWPGSIGEFNLAALLAHEVTHVWQYQRSDLTGYTLAKVIAEHLRYPDPYQYEPLIPGKKFLEYRYEQQGEMIADYVTLHYTAPNGEQYAKLDKLVREVFTLHQFLAEAGLIQKIE